MKDTLVEIKNNLQGKYSRVEEAKNRINDLEYKQTENNCGELQEEKSIQKMRVVKQPLGQKKKKKKKKFNDLLKVT